MFYSMWKHEFSLCYHVELDYMVYHFYYPVNTIISFLALKLLQHQADHWSPEFDVTFDLPKRYQSHDFKLLPLYK